ncbi:MAG: hydantoinase/oxoprolinase family protein [Pseudomonadota bacterium]
MDKMTDHPLLLGVDTGGTYTDAVLVDEMRMEEGPSSVLAAAKSLTTRDDLARGVGDAISQVMGAAVKPGRISMVALSTTLATNALVEGQGGRVALIMIGFDPADIERQGLGEALGSDPLIQLPGGHDAMGAEKAAFNEDALIQALEGVRVGGFAICGHFGVRNPAHELIARDIIRSKTDLPVTCSHELSAQVGGPKRALTALLNARLIGMIDRLIAGVEDLLTDREVKAPLMVVRGDGSLVSARFARQRPIETILSGPAASLVGAGWLTGARDAVVSDIGGTTTDIAVLKDGRPRIDPAGAEVGGMRTMVEAVAMRTHGLGGDSEVGIASTGLKARLTLGPRRVIPVSLLATTAPDLVYSTLRRQRDAARSGELDGQFYVALRPDTGDLDASDAAFLERLQEGPQSSDRLFRNRMERMAAKRLVSRGLIGRSGLTPSDAAHILGRHDGWESEAAVLAGQVFAARRGNDGKAVSQSAEALAERILGDLVRQSAEKVLDAALQEDGFSGKALSSGLLAQAALDGHEGLVIPRLSLRDPLIGLGASAPTYYPDVAETLGSVGLIPDHAGVANAVGAVVGGVRLSQTAAISVPREGIYRAHLPAGPKDFLSEQEATDALSEKLREVVALAAAEAGAAEIEINQAVERSTADIEGVATLIEAHLTITATGRPRHAHDVSLEPFKAMSSF